MEKLRPFLGTVGEDGAGIELTVALSVETKYRQVKRQPTGRGVWSLRELARENVLRNFYLERIRYRILPAVDRVRHHHSKAGVVVGIRNRQNLPRWCRSSAGRPFHITLHLLTPPTEGRRVPERIRNPMASPRYGPFST